MTRGRLLDFFDEYVAAGGKRRRRLSTHVFSRGAAPPSLRVDPIPDDFYAIPEDGMDVALDV